MRTKGHCGPRNIRSQPPRSLLTGHRRLQAPAPAALLKQRTLLRATDGPVQARKAPKGQRSLPIFLLMLKARGESALFRKPATSLFLFCLQAPFTYPCSCVHADLCPQMLTCRHSHADAHMQTLTCRRSHADAHMQTHARRRSHADPHTQTLACRRSRADAYMQMLTCRRWHTDSRTEHTHTLD